MIEINSLHKSYRKARGLDGFSLHLESNELVGLVGPNGAGKTTLIKILATLLPADSGSVRVSGHNVFADPVAVRASLGYLPDVAGIYQDMRIGEFLEFFADAFRLKEPQRTAAIERALERAGLADRRILLHEPKLLLLDEPATGLDPLARIQLREQLRRLHTEGVAILISSHILTDLEDICTRIVFIAEGKNVQETQTAALAAGALAATVRCELEFEGPTEALDRTIASLAGARVLERKDGFLLIELIGNPQQGSVFLGKLLAAGIIILHFDARGPGLEERYRRAFGEHTP